MHYSPIKIYTHEVTNNMNYNVSLQLEGDTFLLFRRIAHSILKGVKIVVVFIEVRGDGLNLLISTLHEA